jgi:sulfite exporter TauE/SafE
MTYELYAVLSLGFGLGLLHALDADHIMAVTSLASGTQSKQRRVVATINFCARWALGHGGILCILASGLLFFGASLPPSAFMIAEKLVGVILIALGAWIIWNFREKKLGLRIHKHGEHLHAHLADEHHKKAPLKDHSPTLVGITHGLAGSAPLLALLPTLNLESKALGLAYVGIFSAGVLCMMFIFGLGFGYAQTWLMTRSQRIFDLSRLSVAGLSIALGTYWVVS